MNKKIISLFAESQYTPEEKIALIEQKFADILAILGLNLNDPSLQKTPKRIAKMYVEEMFAGLDPLNFPKPSFIPNEAPQQTVHACISFTSFCEHHFVPMTGKAFISYIPKQSLIGLSSLNRLVRHYARRPQLQERLTQQLTEALSELLNTSDVAVAIRAKHYCVLAHGQEVDDSALMETAQFKGSFETSEILRREFYDALGRC